LFAGLGASATAIVNADDPRIVEFSKQVLGQQRVLRFGCDARCDVQLVRAESGDDGLHITLAFAGEPTEVRLPLVGRHNAMNAAGAAAAAFAMGLQPAAIARGLQTVRVPGGRLRVLRNVGAGLNVIDDSYNANPGSMRAAFSTLADLAGKQRRVAVLGDMFELGPTGPRLHHEVGLAAAKSQAHVVYAVGPNAEHTAAGAKEGGVESYAFKDVDGLQTALQGTLNAGDWLLVKGSRGMRMERLVEWMVGGGR
jgi:UDP-N-acetylmuramoyl-tripeptide--D-alanyl-D-alanine ligase